MTSPIPRGLGLPLCISLRSGIGAPAGFPKEKAGRRPGVPRGIPLAPLCLLSRRRERRWPAGQTHFCMACWSLSAAAKVGKNAPGVPPDPRWSAGFLLGKPAVARPPEPTIFDKGLRPQALGYRIFLAPCRTEPGGLGPREFGWSSFYAYVPNRSGMPAMAWGTSQ